MKHDGWVATEDVSYTKRVGQFTLMVRMRADARWYWSVELPGDEGDRDAAFTLKDAIVAAEEAMDLIVDELFGEMTLA